MVSRPERAAPSTTAGLTATVEGAKAAAGNTDGEAAPSSGQPWPQSGDAFQATPFLCAAWWDFLSHFAAVFRQHRQSRAAGNNAASRMGRTGRNAHTNSSRITRILLANSAADVEMRFIYQLSGRPRATARSRGSAW